MRPAAAGRTWAWFCRWRGAVLRRAALVHRAVARLGIGAAVIGCGKRALRGAAAVRVFLLAWRWVFPP